MIRALHAISTLLLMTAIGFLLFNLIYQFATSGQIKVLSIQQLWTSFDKPSFETAKMMAESYIPAGTWGMVTDAPAAVVLLILAGIIYLPVRILMLLGFGKKPSMDWRH